MIKYLTLVLLAAVVFSCGGEKTKSEILSDKKEIIDKNDKRAPEEKKEQPDNKETNSLDGKTITGEALVTKSEDTDGGKTYKISMKVMPDDKINGAFTSENEKYLLAGSLTDKTVRCWIMKEEEVGNLRRGVLVGKRNEKGFNGIFRISQTGGAKSRSGTWKAAMTLTD